MDITLLVAIIIAVVLLAAGGFFLVTTRRSVEPGKDETEPEPTGAAAGATAVEDRERDPGTVSTPPAQAPPPVRETVEPAPPELETPPPSAGRMVRLRARLARSQNAFGKGLLNLLSSDSLDEDTWEEIEDTLITADIGVASAAQIVENLRTRVKVLGTRGTEEVRTLLREELLAQITTGADRAVRTGPHDGRPGVVMVVGVNGTGKTTTTGKLARVLVGDGRSVVLGAADTFRAAATEQLETWGSRVGAPVVRKEEGADPASVAFDAVARGVEEGADTVIIDTAGRLHTKTGLMDELGKVKRVVEKKSQVDEVLLVLDATTGQNGLRQARVFGEVVNVTGIALTKLDGTAKGGIIVQVQRELGVPVKLVGLGEGPDDLAPFDPEVFVDAILSTE
ncbi:MULTISPECIES: signal recognition particle-docking protein FtsY [Nocardiopsis]|uniref:Signal recognition particle receptor FtsY n=2 Tax=Nocardiopsis TaxID=2013 RepID=D7AUB2_NOCDD|nr:signal recognition particle-docking protein FtsY [Nocardiopsis dassonvillei]ADH65670.1 signal recognition particle-docking protein FtsY [Nocardiopsis dassonvillei subsp. dassonvillei DSM 43111]APC34024.1 signal recognition particle-docking protein FtsY [Nocardiopsis dassonvillei]NKY79709.1 signal recognition particle-docking protein FtsY [Nocardiopsis dassonvillei]VEI91689.1 Cell division protein FtsY homolog [Nocardiopsis dassonvillei]